jgi:hypothetical protein
VCILNFQLCVCARWYRCTLMINLVQFSLCQSEKAELDRAGKGMGKLGSLEKWKWESVVWPEFIHFLRVVHDDTPTSCTSKCTLG